MMSNNGMLGNNGGDVMAQAVFQTVVAIVLMALVIVLVGH